MNKIETTLDVEKKLIRQYLIMMSLILAILLGMSGCMAGLAPSQPGAVPTQPGPGVPPGGGATVPVPAEIPTLGVVLDTSDSVLATDIPVMAQNRLSNLVLTMPVGSRVVMRAVNSNVTAMCQDLVISLPPQPNKPVEDQIRQANQAAIAGKVKNYIACSQQQATGGTEFWGGLAETYTSYPNAQLFAYGDTCENVTIHPDTCTAEELRNPAFPDQVVDQLAAAGLIPQLKPGLTITFVGVGRNARLQAGELNALRQIAVQWAQRAGITATFDTK